MKISNVSAKNTNNVNFAGLDNRLAIKSIDRAISVFPELSISLNKFKNNPLASVPDTLQLRKVHIMKDDMSDKYNATLRFMSKIAGEVTEYTGSFGFKRGSEFISTANNMTLDIEERSIADTVSSLAIQGRLSENVDRIMNDTYNDVVRINAINENLALDNSVKTMKKEGGWINRFKLFIISK